MKQPDIDPRYTTADGCRQLAREMDAQAKSARLLMRRDEGWAKALRSRADRIEEAETLELEAQAKRMAAASVGNRPYKRDDVFEQLFGFLRT
jgi:hypothetical protein